MAEKHKVKISLLGGMKEYEIEVDDKKKFMKEIEEYYHTKVMELPSNISEIRTISSIISFPT